MPLGRLFGVGSLGKVFETTRDLEYCMRGRPEGVPGDGEPIGEEGKAPGIESLCEERGRAKSDVDGCCCKGLGISTGVLGREDFLGGGEGGGGGMSVPAVRDSEEKGSAGSWKGIAETLCVYVAMVGIVWCHRASGGRKGVEIWKAFDGGVTGRIQSRVTGVVDYGLFSQIIHLCTRERILTTTKGVDRLKLEVHSLELCTRYPFC